MNIEHHMECEHDMLVVFQGDSGQSVIHRYCIEENDTDSSLERFRKIKSRGRDLTLEWYTDASITKKGGFTINYEFVDYDSCKRYPSPENF